VYAAIVTREGGVSHIHPSLEERSGRCDESSFC
jgi:hypothetical protein